MPTVAELAIWSAPLGLTVEAGGLGLARDITSIVRLSPDRLEPPLHGGDVVLVSASEWASIPALVAHLSRIGIAATVVADRQDDNPIDIEGTWRTPVVVVGGGVQLDRIEHLALGWLAQRQILEEQIANDLRTEFAEFVRAGARVEAVVTHLARLAGNLLLLHDASGAVRFADAAMDK